MENCYVCFEDYIDGVICLQCKNSVCLRCFGKIDRCGLCRWKYEPPNYQTALKQINQSVNNITTLLQTVENSLRRIRLMSSIQNE